MTRRTGKEGLHARVVPGKHPEPPPIDAEDWPCDAEFDATSDYEDWLPARDWDKGAPAARRDR